MRKILVISLQGTGNLLLALPAVERYVKKYPAMISLVIANTGINILLSRLNYIDKIYLWNNANTVFNNIKRLYKAIKPNNYERIIVLEPAGARENVLLFFLRKLYKEYTIFNRSSFRMMSFLNPKGKSVGERHHDALMNCKLLGTEINYAPNSFEGIITDEERAYAQKILDKYNLPFYISLHPGSVAGSDHRRWAVKNYIVLSKKLVNKYNCGIIIVGGEEELELRKKIGGEINNNSIILKNETIPVTLAFMKESHLFIGNDSGPMHLASTIRTPALSIWGCGDYRITSPLSKNCWIVRKNLPGSPCYRFETNKIKTCQDSSYCIQHISFDDVWFILNNYISMVLKKGDYSAIMAMLSERKEFNVESLINGPTVFHIS